MIVDLEAEGSSGGVSRWGGQSEGPGVLGHHWGVDSGAGHNSGECPGA